MIVQLFHCAAMALYFTEENCPTFNNSKHFGPIKDQADRGFCHAFATARLFEEAHCIENSSFCGKQMSPLSIGRWTTDLMSVNATEDGWFPDVPTP